MKNIVSGVVGCALLFLSLSGCVSYTTLQSAKTLDPGEVHLGAGAGCLASEDRTPVQLELGMRVGIVQNFDAGAKYIMPNFIFLDGKYQILSGPVNLSFDLGYSYFRYFGDFSHSSKGSGSAWYPMLIVGQDYWYAGIKRVYFSTQGEIEVIGLNKFETSGWMSTNIVAGGIIGTSVRLLPEINIIIPPRGKTLVVPALGFQFQL